MQGSSACLDGQSSRCERNAGAPVGVYALRMNRTSLRALLLPLALLACAAAPDREREVMELSEHGSVLGPMSRPDGQQDEAQALEIFVQGLELMGRVEYRAAADSFDSVYRRTGWPESAYNAALAWYAEGTFDAALERADRAEELLPGDPGVMYLRGVLLQAIGRHEDATAVIEATLARSRADGQRHDEAIGLLNLGSSARLLGRPEDALSHFADARALGEELEMPGVVAGAWMGEAQVRLALGDRAGADRALDAARRLGRRQAFGAARADADLAEAAVALAEGREVRARQLLDRARDRIDGIEERTVRASMRLTVAGLERELGDRAAAEATLARAEEEFRDSGVDVGRAHTLQSRGAWALADGDLVAAEGLLLEALEIQRRFQVPLAEALTRRYLAELRGAQGRLAEALELALEACAAFADAQAVELERSSLVTLAGIRSMRGELEQARTVAERALGLAREVGDGRDVHRLRSEIAILHAAGGDLAAAEAELRSVPPAAFARLPARQRARVHLQLAWSLRTDQRPAEAAARGRRALEAASGPHPQEDLVAGAREVIVFSLVEAGKQREAERFVDGLGDGQEELRDWIRQKTAVDRYNRGVELLQEGRLAEAIEAFEQVHADDQVDPDRRSTAAGTLQGVLLQHGQELMAAGALEDAEAQLVRAAEIARGRKDGLGEATVLAVRAEVRERVGDAPGAAELAGAAAELASAGGDRSLAGDCWMIAGQALFDADPEGARKAFADALAAWGDEPPTLGRRAAVTYNLAVLDLRLEVGDARLRFGEARALAHQAGDAGLVSRIDEILAELESE